MKDGMPDRAYSPDNFDECDTMHRHKSVATKVDSSQSDCRKRVKVAFLEEQQRWLVIKKSSDNTSRKYCGQRSPFVEAFNLRPSEQ